MNLNGVWNTVMATAPIMCEEGNGGAIVLISSTQALKGVGGDGTAGITALVSDHAKYVTGVTLPVGAGFTTR